MQKRQNRSPAQLDSLHSTMQDIRGFGGTQKSTAKMSSNILKKQNKLFAQKPSGTNMSLMYKYSGQLSTLSNKAGLMDGYVKKTADDFGISMLKGLVSRKIKRNTPAKHSGYGTTKKLPGTPKPPSPPPAPKPPTKTDNPRSRMKVVDGGKVPTFPKKPGNKPTGPYKPTGYVGAKGPRLKVKATKGARGVGGGSQSGGGGVGYSLQTRGGTSPYFRGK